MVLSTSHPVQVVPSLRPHGRVCKPRRSASPLESLNDVATRRPRVARRLFEDDDDDSCRRKQIDDAISCDDSSTDGDDESVQEMLSRILAERHAHFLQKWGFDVNEGRPRTPSSGRRQWHWEPM